VIIGSSYGIYNGGTITLIDNAGGGLISGNTVGIYNSISSIGQITNGGTISGNDTGIFTTAARSAPSPIAAHSRQPCWYIQQQ